MTQRERIHEWLKSGSTLTALQAGEIMGIERLAARVCELRKTVDVKDRWLSVTNRYGEECRVKEYYMDLTRYDTTVPFKVLFDGPIDEAMFEPQGKLNI